MLELLEKQPHRVSRHQFANPARTRLPHGFGLAAPLQEDFQCRPEARCGRCVSKKTRDAVFNEFTVAATSVAITGRPHSMASLITRGRPSNREGMTSA